MAATYVIYNPDSGGRDCKDELDLICSQLKAELVPLADLEKRWDQMQKTAKMVVAAGGDGTVSAVAGKLVETELILGVIPAGTLNHFAKDLGLPMDLAKAGAVVKAGKVMVVDTAQVNGHSFVNNSSIGVYPEMVKTRDKYAETTGKWPAALWSLLMHLPAPRAYYYELVKDGKNSTCHTPFIFVGNNFYNIEEAGIANRTKLNEGKLCIYVIKTKSPVRLLGLAVKSLLGRVETEPGFDTFTAEEFSIVSRRRQTADVALDGEVKRLDFPLRYKIRPQSLKVIVS